MKCTFFNTTIYIIILLGSVAAQPKPLKLDTVAPKLLIDTAKATKPHSPKLALKRSAMLPGWGQVYNKQAWKLPIIYGALGVTGYIFVDNIRTYNDVRFAYNARINKDSLAITQIKAYLKNIDVGGLQINRRKFRQYIDYSVLFFVAFWGLNMADAVVFAHLKNFDVSNNISGTLNIGSSSLTGTTGINLQFNLHKKVPTKLAYTK